MMRILIVDDEPINLYLIKEMLGSAYEIDTAEDGIECLEKCASFKPDLILLDVMMPRMDGFETLKKIKTDSVLSKIYVIMVTAKVEKEDVKEAFTNGASDYIKKPIDITELLYKVSIYEELLSKQNTIDKLDKILEINEDVLNAKHVQQSLLPDQNTLQKIFPDYFIIHMPKFIVGGDFYFVAELNGRRFLSLFDATGHGVTAGMSSIVSYMILSQIVLTENITEPNEVAYRFKSELIKLLSRTADVYSKNYFGFDGFFCEFTQDNTLKFVGAHRPLLFIREKSDSLILGKETIRPLFQKDGYSLFSIKGCKQSMDIEASNYEFVQKEIKLQPNDRLYFTSDGFADQLNGRNMKKMTAKRMNQFLIDLQTTQFSRQKLSMYRYFKEWKGNCEQTDDVIILGLKI